MSEGLARSWNRGGIFAVALVCACHASPQDGQRAEPAPPASASAVHDTVLAQFDDHALTVSEFEARLASQPPEVRARYATPEARVRLLDDMVRLEVLLAEAKRRGFDRSPRVKVRVSELVVEEMMNSLFGSEAVEAAGITDDEVRRYYDAHVAEFRSPAGVRTMDDVRTLISARLAQEKRRDAIARFTEDLRARSQPRLHPERLPAPVPAPSASAGTL